MVMYETFEKMILLANPVSIGHKMTDANNKSADWLLLRWMITPAGNVQQRGKKVLE